MATRKVWFAVSDSEYHLSKADMTHIIAERAQAAGMSAYPTETWRDEWQCLTYYYGYQEIPEDLISMLRAKDGERVASP